MSEPLDISEWLSDWPFDPDNPGRIVRASDGREILQVRTPLGVEQLEMRGRPDGARPHGLESALEFHLRRLASAEDQGREADFELSEEDCAELFNEGTLYYFRYLHLFQLQRWVETERDTARNLRLFNFVHQYAAREEDREYLEKWRPYILRINAAASALQTVEQGDAAKALPIIRTALGQITELGESDSEVFQFERRRSEVALRELLSQLEQLRPVSPLERLEKQLRTAIECQDFERAAKLRDRIRELRAQEPARQAASSDPDWHSDPQAD